MSVRQVFAEYRFSSCEVFLKIKTNLFVYLILFIYLILNIVSAQK